MTRPTAVERAFELAKSGEVSGIAEIAKILNREGYSVQDIHGPSLRRQLRALIAHAKASRGKVS
jgi:hypothetical protein